MNISDLLRKKASEFKDKVFLREGKEVVTFREFVDRATKAANYFNELDLHVGDNVGIALRNSQEMIYSFFGLLVNGCVPVPVNPNLSASDIFRLASNSDQKALITTPLIKNKLSRGNYQLERIVLVDFLDPSNNELEMGIASASSKLQSRCDIEPEDLATIVYTSGTTGEPLGAMLSHSNLIGNGKRYANLPIMFNEEAIGTEDKVIGVLPFFYSFGINAIIMGSVNSGAEVRLVEKFNAQDYWEIFEHDRTTIIMAVPTMYKWLLEQLNYHPTVDLSSFRLGISAGAPLSSDLQEHYFERKMSLINVLGFAEASISVANMYTGNRISSVGKAVEEVTVHLVDEKGDPVPEGQIGEIVIEGENVFLGYYNNRDETEEILRNDWFYTGDMGRLGSEGHLYLHGRKDDQLCVGAEKFYPAEVENIIKGLPEIENVIVLGVPDPDFGTVPVALVQLGPSEKVDRGTIVKYCRHSLQAIRVPRRIEFTDEIPVNDSGKVSRKDLAKTYFS